MDKMQEWEDKKAKALVIKQLSVPEHSATENSIII